MIWGSRWFPSCELDRFFDMDNLFVMKCLFVILVINSNSSFQAQRVSFYMGKCGAFEKLSSYTWNFHWAAWMPPFRIWSERARDLISESNPWLQIHLIGGVYPSKVQHGTGKWHPGIGDSFRKPSFLGSMLNLGCLVPWNMESVSAFPKEKSLQIDIRNQFWVVDNLLVRPHFPGRWVSLWGGGCR